MLRHGTDYSHSLVKVALSLARLTWNLQCLVGISSFLENFSSVEISSCHGQRLKTKANNNKTREEIALLHSFVRAKHDVNNRRAILPLLLTRAKHNFLFHHVSLRLLVSYPLPPTITLPCYIDSDRTKRKNCVNRERREGEH